MAGGTQIPIRVSEDGSAALVRPEGACTVTLCQTLSGYLDHCRNAGISDLYLDLTQADRLDSTFTGWMLALATGKKAAGPRLHLYRPSPTARQALDNMHVLPLFDIVDRVPVKTNAERLLDGQNAAPDQLGRLVVDAHEKLIAADPRNGPTFQPVVDVFRKSVKDK